MAQPTPYTRQFNFEDFQQTNPTTPLPAASVEGEYNALKITTDGILTNLALIQRDDGKLANTSVHVNALETAVRNLIALNGINIRGDWLDATAYAVGDVVVDNSTPYLAFVAHTSSGSIDTTKFVALTSPLPVPGDPDDDNKFLRAASGVGTWVTFTASMISDVVAALQSVITAANLAAARTALGVTATGDSLVTAASVAAARTALGATTVGANVFTAADAAAVRTEIDAARLAGTNTFTATQTIQSTATDANEGPTAILDRNSASPADNDLLGAIELRGRSDLPTVRTMAKILAQVLDVSDTTEDAILAFQTMIAGSLATRGHFGNGLVIGAPTGGDQGAGSINAQSILVNGSAVGGGIWTEITAGTISAASTFSFTFTPASFRAIKILLTDILPASDGVTLQMRTSTNAGSSYDAGAADYRDYRINLGNGGTVGGASSGGGGANRIQVGGTQGFIADQEESSYEITLFDPATVQRKNIWYSGVTYATDGSSSFQIGAGVRFTAADVDGIQFLYSTGNIVSGRYQIFGLDE